MLLYVSANVYSKVKLRKIICAVIGIKLHTFIHLAMLQKDASALEKQSTVIKSWSQVCWAMLLEER